MDIEGYLKQTEIWYANPGTEVKIADMDTEHAVRAAQWLSRSATALIGMVENSLNAQGEIQQVLELIASSPKGWIIRQPLYRALIERARS